MVVLMMLNFEPIGICLTGVCEAPRGIIVYSS